MAIGTSMDLDLSFNTNKLALNVTYIAAGESAARIPVLFDTPFNSVLLDKGEMDVESNIPTCLCRQSDLSAAAHGDVIALSGTTCHFVGIQEDSGNEYQDMTLLVLEQQ